MEYGKFNSAEELLKGYNELEKSFTQKCQQLAELRNKLAETPIAESGTIDNPNPQPIELQAQATTDTEQGGTNEASSPLNTMQGNGPAAEEKATCAVPTDVDAPPVASNGPSPNPLPKVMQGGGNVSMALPTKPKTIKEASALARKLFGNS